MPTKQQIAHELTMLYMKNMTDLSQITVAYARVYNNTYQSILANL